MTKERRYRFLNFCTGNRWYKPIATAAALYRMPDERLSGRQRLRKLRLLRYLLSILVIVSVMWSVLMVLIYLQVQSGIHIENAPYVHTGKTSVNCYRSFHGGLICCAEKPMFKRQYLNSTRKPVAGYECYKYQEID